MIESRIQKEYKLFQLLLNPVTANAEAGNTIAIAATPEELHQWMLGEKAEEPYIDGQYQKTFKQGSVIENYNPLVNDDILENCAASKTSSGQGIREAWVDQETLIGYIDGCINSFGMEAIPHLIGEVEDLYNQPVEH